MRRIVTDQKTPRMLEIEEEVNRQRQKKSKLDSINDGIIAIETAFRNQRFCVPASIQLDEVTSLCWEKRGKLWGLHIEKVSGKCHVSSEFKTETVKRPVFPELRDTKPLIQSKLMDRLMAIEKMPEMYAEMKFRTRTKTEEVQGALAAVDAFLESMKAENNAG